MKILKQPLVIKEGEDYYFNKQGLMVLTEKYLLKRGDCCGSGCLHCPYEHRNVEVKKGKGKKEK